MSLSVPTPTVSQDGAALTEFSAVMPVGVACGPVTFPDGTELALHTAQTFGLRLRRRLVTNVVEVWDDEAQSWQPDGSAPALLPMFLQNGLWQSLLVDTKGAIFGTDPSTGRPEYFVACTFAGTDGQGAQHTGTSPASPAFRAFKTEDQNRTGVTIEPAPDEADEIRLFLKDSGLVERASLTIRTVSGAFQVELVARGTSLTWSEDGEAILRAANGRQAKLSVAASGDLVLAPDVSGPARLTLRRNGDIVIDPAAGRTAMVQGNVNVVGTLSVNGTPLHVP